MPAYTLRRQAKTGDERQLFSPSQLEEGMHIAVVSIIEGASLNEKLIRTAVAFTGLFGREEGEPRRDAARRAWRFEDSAGQLPKWSGIIKWCNSEGAQVRLTGFPKSLKFDELIALDPAELPSPDEPMELYDTFASMGLSKVQPTASDLRIGIDAEDIGRWQPRATLLLDSK